MPKSMTRRTSAVPDAPCDHWGDLIGTVEAGSINGPGPFCGVSTCLPCVEKSRGYVQMRTGLPATQLLTYEDSRAAKKPRA